MIITLDPNEDLDISEGFQPDRFFSATQQKRLCELMEKWQTARDAGTTLSTEEQAELEALTEAELLGMIARALSFGSRR